MFWPAIGQEIAAILESHAEDPFERRVREFVSDEKVATLVRGVLQTNREESQQLARTVGVIHSSLQDRALFDGALWAAQAAIFAIVLLRLNDAQSGKRPFDT